MGSTHAKAITRTHNHFQNRVIKCLSPCQVSSLSFILNLSCVMLATSDIVLSHQNSFFHVSSGHVKGTCECLVEPGTGLLTVLFLPRMLDFKLLDLFLQPFLSMFLWCDRPLYLAEWKLHICNNEGDVESGVVKGLISPAYNCAKSPSRSGVSNVRPARWFWKV